MPGTNDAFDNIINVLQQDGGAHWSQPVKDFFAEGVESLDNSAATTLDTNVRLQNMDSFINRQLRQAIDPQGRMFTNKPDADGRMAATPGTFALSEDDKFRRDMYAWDEMARLKGFNQSMWLQARSEFEAAQKLEQGYTGDINPATNPVMPAAALTELAREAALQGLVTAIPKTAGLPSAAQAAVMEGLKEGLHQRREELEIARERAQPYISGLCFLCDLSGGNLAFYQSDSPDSSDINLQVINPKTGKVETPFERSLRIGTGFADVPARTPQEQMMEAKAAYTGGAGLAHALDDALDDGAADDILAGIAKAATFAGLIPDAADLKLDEASHEWQAILDGVRQARHERKFAADAANPVLDELAYLQKLSGNRLNVTSTPATDSGNIVIRLSANDAPFTRTITADKNGKATLEGFTTKNGAPSSKEYKPADDMTALLAEVARQAVFDGRISSVTAHPDPSSPGQRAIYDAVHAAEADRNREARLRTSVHKQDVYGRDESGSLKHVLAAAIADRKRKDAEAAVQNSSPAPAAPKPRSDIH